MTHTLDRMSLGRVSISNVGTVECDVNPPDPIPRQELADKAVE